MNNMTGMIKRAVTKTVNTALNVTKFGIGAFITFEYIGGFVVCVGPSMEPTITTKDILLTDHITPRFGLVTTGDVVVAKCPINRQHICKRVVGVSGDKVKYQGQVITIPEGFVWLEGDNKHNSQDSRQYGPVPVNMIRRKCFGKIYPNIDFNFHEAIDYYADASVNKH